MKALVIFNKLVQDSQEYGSDNEHMVSRLYFDLEIDGKKHLNLFVDIKQTVGSILSDENIEVSSPTEYKGKFNYDDFRKGVINYYRKCFGPQGVAIRVGENVKCLRMQNNVFSITMVHEFEIG